MSHVFQISNEKYEKLAAYAHQQEQTPEELLTMWIDDAIRQIDASNATKHEESLDEVELSEEEWQELRAKHPILQLSGIFPIGEPGLADRHDEYLAEAYADDHAEE